VPCGIPYSTGRGEDGARDGALYEGLIREKMGLEWVEGGWKGEDGKGKMDDGYEAAPIRRV